MTAFSLPLEESPSTAGATKLPFGVGNLGNTCPIHSALLPSTSPRLHAPNRRDEHPNITPSDSHFQNALSTIATRGDDELQCAQAEIARLKLQLQRAELTIATKAKENARLISQLHDAEDAHSSTAQQLEDANATIASLMAEKREAADLKKKRGEIKTALMFISRTAGHKYMAFELADLVLSDDGTYYAEILYYNNKEKTVSTEIIGDTFSFADKYLSRTLHGLNVGRYGLFIYSVEDRVKRESAYLERYAATFLQNHIRNNKKCRGAGLLEMIEQNTFISTDSLKEAKEAFAKLKKRQKIMALLELALWKANLDDVVDNWGRNEKEVKRVRYERRITSRASIVIINVLPFLEV